ncbi:hypothetical protein GCM10007916_05840 [Psychromonas marina]|uniref:Uncharacterized protein n=1 Tax=Psychromonas marina TaxID=88364 RepID=A0ABQ6DWS6_9GAMM|nr:hypothetical protein GCM10007916_05840 [Psychromonas marina]
MTKLLPLAIDVYLTDTKPTNQSVLICANEINLLFHSGDIYEYGKQQRSANLIRAIIGDTALGV